MENTFQKNYVMNRFQGSKAIYSFKITKKKNRMLMWKNRMFFFRLFVFLLRCKMLHISWKVPVGNVSTTLEYTMIYGISIKILRWNLLRMACRAVFQVKNWMATCIMNIPKALISFPRNNSYTLLAYLQFTNEIQFDFGCDCFYRLLSLCHSTAVNIFLIIFVFGWGETKKPKKKKGKRKMKQANKNNNKYDILSNTGNEINWNRNRTRNG